MPLDTCDAWMAMHDIGSSGDWLVLPGARQRVGAPAPDAAGAALHGLQGIGMDAGAVAAATVELVTADGQRRVSGVAGIELWSDEAASGARVSETAAGADSEAGVALELGLPPCFDPRTRISSLPANCAKHKPVFFAALMSDCVRCMPLLGHWQPGWQLLLDADWLLHRSPALRGAISLALQERMVRSPAARAETVAMLLRLLARPDYQVRAHAMHRLHGAHSHVRHRMPSRCAPSWSS